MAASGCGAGPDTTRAPSAGSYTLWSAQQWITRALDVGERSRWYLMNETSRVG
jgi:hypothetical protein